MWKQQAGWRWNAFFNVKRIDVRFYKISQKLFFVFTPHFSMVLWAESVILKKVFVKYFSSVSCLAFFEAFFLMLTYNELSLFSIEISKQK